VRIREREEFMYACFLSRAACHEEMTAGSLPARRPAIISLYAKGLTTGEIQAHLADVYGAEVHSRADLRLSRRLRYPAAHARRGQAARGPDARGMPETRAGRCRAVAAASRPDGPHHANDDKPALPRNT
jgi:hypothetical protein